MIIKVETNKELQTLVTNSKALVLDFYADWCGPCRKLGEYLETIKDNEKYKDIVFCKVNVDNSEFEEVCQEHKVSGIPHVVFFKNSKVSKSVVGFNKNDIDSALDSLTN